MPAMLKPKVLFLCTGNAARSQMAEGWLKHIAGERFEVFSAGIAPRGLHPIAVAVMGEAGIDISRQQSKHVREFLGVAVGYVITVCDNAREHCPVFPGAYTYLHWGLDDPAAVGGSEEEKLAAFRRVRDQIADRVREFAGNK
jgi:arsenate reductase